MSKLQSFTMTKHSSSSSFRWSTVFCQIILNCLKLIHWNCSWNDDSCSCRFFLGLVWKVSSFQQLWYLDLNIPQCQEEKKNNHCDRTFPSAPIESSTLADCKMIMIMFLNQRRSDYQVKAPAELANRRHTWPFDHLWQSQCTTDIFLSQIK